MNELEFTIEFNSEDLYETTEAALFREADRRLRDLADGHSDLIGSAVTIRHPAAAMYEATVVVYGRPDHLSATEKESDPTIALKGALKAIERQVRQRRDKLRKTWEQPGNHPMVSGPFWAKIIGSRGRASRSASRGGSPEPCANTATARLIPITELNFDLQ